jgi:hypothetical protein
VMHISSSHSHGRLYCTAPSHIHTHTITWQSWKGLQNKQQTKLASDG